MRPWLAALGLCVAVAAHAQERAVAARVTQIAGADLYLDAGSNAGLARGDTLVVRRATGAAPVGTFVVVAVTETRAVVSFAGAPFPLTRGDALVLTAHGPAAPVAPPAAPAAAPPPAPRAVTALSGPQLRGSVAMDVLGSHSTTIGFGANPERVGRDYAIPAMRLQAVMSNLPGGGRFVTSVQGTQQVGAASLFDRGTVLRVYDAHYEQDLGAAHFALGRFFSPYEPFSGVWDGALVRVGGAQGFGLGVEGGFQPRLGDEGFTTATPKFAAFADFRHFAGAVRLSTNVSAHIWRPTDGTADRTFLGWSQQLALGSVRLDHAIELDQTAGGGWSLTRFDARAAVPVTAGLQLSAEYYRDRLGWLDIASDSLLPREDRASASASYQFGAGFVSAGVTLLVSGTTVQGHTYSGSLAFPRVVGPLSFSGAVSYWSLGASSGLVATPTVAWRLRTLRPSLTYEFFRSTAAGVSSISHGGNLSLALPLARGLESIVRLTVRYGQNVQSFGMYSSLRLSF
jgi:hypothetical protein